MEQYFRIRNEYSDAILLFQVGDFYELFFEDAKKASSFLAIALTKRGTYNGEPIPLCGVPIHAINHYLIKLVKGGFKVAICDQLEKPQPGRVVERGVTRVLTPGTLTDSVMMDEKSASYLLSFYPHDQQWGLIFTELLTAQMFATVVPKDSFRMIESELVRFFPDEIIVPKIHTVPGLFTYFKKQGYFVSPWSETNEQELASTWIEQNFTDSVLKSLHDHKSIQNSLQLLYWYLKKNQEQALEQLHSIQFYKPEDYLILDASTQRNLELTRNAQDGSSKNTLLSILDKSVTPMGSRTIKKWLQRPLVQKKAIIQRQEMVGRLCKHVESMQQLEELFSQISDLERIIGRIALRRALLPDYLALKRSLRIIPHMKVVLFAHLQSSLARIIDDKLVDFRVMVDFLESALEDESTSKWIIRRGFDLELDRLRGLVENSQKEVVKMEREEVERTGITSLKIRYNNIAGYFIEVTKPNLHLVPDDYIQQQTLVNRNRYVTQKLKDLERDILRAQNEIDQVQDMAFERVKVAVEERLSVLRQTAQAIAYLDALLGFARIAYDNAYVAPELHDSRDIVIVQGRHPVVENSRDISFISNDTQLDDTQSLWVLTGPNMGGKSTYLRQVAQICLMAQAGSFVPAQNAKLSILDRIFTRIGSGDNLAEGKSTFLVEMEETALICNSATKNSLVILDEVGRGTSTFDGMALAQAIIEYIATEIKSRCLFATHYHELTHLKESIVGIENYHVTCKRTDGGILFLHHVVKGVSEGSFGLDVARLANLPEKVVARAAEILGEKNAFVSREGGRDIFYLSARPEGERIAEASRRMPERHGLTPAITQIIKELEAVSLDELSPRQAFDLVWSLKEKQRNL